LGYTLLVQDWVTVRGGGSVVVLQPEGDYLDISALEDFASYIEISDFVAGAGTTLKLQTAPLKEEAYFQDVVTLTVDFGLAVNVVRNSGGGTSPANWLRWRAHSASGLTWGVTFRACINGNPVGSTR